MNSKEEFDSKELLEGAGGKMQSSDCQGLVNFLKLRMIDYEKESAKMESIMQELHLCDQRMKIPEDVSRMVEKLSQLQQKLGVKDLTPNAVALSYSQKLREQDHYFSKLKICLKLYHKLNTVLTKRIEYLKRYYKEAQNNVQLMIPSNFDEERKSIENKIKVYNEELSKLEKKNPWLKETEYDLSYISKEISLLDDLRREKEQLLEELNKYGGLKPDLAEANEQLNEVKKEFVKLNEQLY